MKITEKTKGTLYMVLTVLISFTLINVIKGTTEWWMYLLTIVVLPLITWGICEVTYFFMKKDMLKNLNK